MWQFLSFKNQPGPVGGIGFLYPVKVEQFPVVAGSAKEDLFRQDFNQ